MKKTLITIVIILLLILTCFTLIKGISFLNIKGINDIKVASNKLNSDFEEANNLSNKTYPEETEGLEEAIRKLKISKQEYESKSLKSEDKNSLGTVEIKTYKIHYLWTILGNYRKDRGVQSLSLDLKSTQNKDVYDLDFTLLGSYTSITDFLYDIENDEELNFEIKNFTITSELEDTTTQTNAEENNNNNVLNDTQNNDDNNNNEQTTNSTEDNKNISTANKKQNDGITLKAKFTVESVGITLD